MDLKRHLPEGFDAPDARLAGAPVASRPHAWLGPSRLAQLGERRDARREGFARVMEKAFETRLGDKAEHPY